MRTRAWAAAVGAGMGASLSLVPALAIVGSNPWFMDSPGLYLALIWAPLALTGLASGALLRAGRTAGGAGLVAVGVSAAAVAGLSVWPKPAPLTETKLFVMGIDGAGWDVLDPLAADLPNLMAMKGEGASATLRVVDPLFSPLLWTSLASGKPRSEHGVSGFHVHATDCKSGRYWDVMHAAGESVGTYKWLVTWPPTEIGAFQVPAWLAPSPETWPAELAFVKEVELANRMKRQQVAARRSMGALVRDGVRHGFRFSTLVRAARFAASQRYAPDPLRAALEGQLLRAQMDRDVFVHTIHATRPSVATFTDYATDAVGHRFWRYHEPALFPDTDPALVARYGDAVSESYRQADEIFGELRAQFGPDTRVVVLSDHGFQGMQGEALGHLLAPRTEHLAEVLKAQAGDLDVSRLGHKLVVTLKSADVATQKAAVEAVVLSVTLERTGARIFRVEPGPDDASVGVAVLDAGLSPATLDTDRAGGVPLTAWLSKGESFSGDHHDRGIWMSSGPGLATGAIPEVGIYEVAPTLLALVGLPGALDMSGEAVGAVFAGGLPPLPPKPASYDSLAAARKFTVLPESNSDVNTEQLEALGYTER